MSQFKIASTIYVSVFYNQIYFKITHANIR